MGCLEAFSTSWPKTAPRSTLTTISSRSPAQPQSGEYIALKRSPASFACHSKMPRGVEERKKLFKITQLSPFMFKFQKQMLLTDLPLKGDSRRNIHFPCCKVVLFGVLLLQAVWHRSVPDLLPIYPQFQGRYWRNNVTV